MMEGVKIIEDYKRTSQPGEDNVVSLRTNTRVVQSVELDPTSATSLSGGIPVANASVGQAGDRRFTFHHRNHRNSSGNVRGRRRVNGPATHDPANSAQTQAARRRKIRLAQQASAERVSQQQRAVPRHQLRTGVPTTQRQSTPSRVSSPVVAVSRWFDQLLGKRRTSSPSSIQQQQRGESSSRSSRASPSKPPSSSRRSSCKSQKDRQPPSSFHHGGVHHHHHHHHVRSSDTRRKSMELSSEEVLSLVGDQSDQVSSMRENSGEGVPSNSSRKQQPSTWAEVDAAQPPSSWAALGGASSEELQHNGSALVYSPSSRYRRTSAAAAAAAKEAEAAAAAMTSLANQPFVSRERSTGRRSLNVQTPRSAPAAEFEALRAAAAIRAAAAGQRAHASSPLLRTHAEAHYDQHTYAPLSPPPGTVGYRPRKRRASLPRTTQVPAAAAGNKARSSRSASTLETHAGKHFSRDIPYYPAATAAADTSSNLSRGSRPVDHRHHHSWSTSSQDMDRGSHEKNDCASDPMQRRTLYAHEGANFSQSSGQNQTTRPQNHRLQKKAMFVEKETSFSASSTGETGTGRIPTSSKDPTTQRLRSSSVDGVHLKSQSFLNSRNSSANPSALNASASENAIFSGKMVEPKSLASQLGVTVPGNADLTLEQWLGNESIHVAAIGAGDSFAHNFLVNVLLRSTWEGVPPERLLREVDQPRADVVWRPDAAFLRRVPDLLVREERAQKRHVIEAVRGGVGTNLKFTSRGLAGRGGGSSSLAGAGSKKEGDSTPGKTAAKGSDPTGFLLPEAAPFEQAVFVMSYAPLAHLVVDIPSERVVRDTLWKLHLVEQGMVQMNEKQLFRLQRQYAALMGISVEQVPLRDCRSPLDLPISSNILSLLGKTVCCKGIGADVHADRLYLREQLHILGRRFGGLLTRFRLMVPCNLFSRNVELTIAGADALQPMLCSQLRRCSLLLAAVDARGITPGVARLLDTSRYWPEFFRQRSADRRRIVFVQLPSEQVPASAYSQEAQELEKTRAGTTPAEHRALLRSQVASVLQRQALKNHVPFDASTRKAISGLVSVLVAKPLLFCSLPATTSRGPGSRSSVGGASTNNSSSQKKPSSAQTTPRQANEKNVDNTLMVPRDQDLRPGVRGSAGSLGSGVSSSGRSLEEQMQVDMELEGFSSSEESQGLYSGSGWPRNRGTGGGGMNQNSSLNPPRSTTAASGEVSPLASRRSSLSKLRSSTNVPALVGSIQNLALRKCALPLLRTNAQLRKRTSMENVNVSMVLPREHAQQLVRYNTSSVDRMRVVAKETIESWKKELTKSAELIDARLRRKASQCVVDAEGDLPTVTEHVMISATGGGGGGGNSSSSECSSPDDHKLFGRFSGSSSGEEKRLSGESASSEGSEYSPPLPRTETTTSSSAVSELTCGALIESAPQCWQEGVLNRAPQHLVKVLHASSKLLDEAHSVIQRQVPVDTPVEERARMEHMLGAARLKSEASIRQRVLSLRDEISQDARKIVREACEDAVHRDLLIRARRLSLGNGNAAGSLSEFLHDHPQDYHQATAAATMEIDGEERETDSVVGATNQMNHHHHHHHHHHAPQGEMVKDEEGEISSQVHYFRTGNANLPTHRSSDLTAGGHVGGSGCSPTDQVASTRQYEQLILDCLPRASDRAARNISDKYGALLKRAIAQLEFLEQELGTAVHTMYRVHSMCAPRMAAAAAAAMKQNSEEQMTFGQLSSSSQLVSAGHQDRFGRNENDFDNDGGEQVLSDMKQVVDKRKVSTIRANDADHQRKEATPQLFSRIPPSIQLGIERKEATLRTNGQMSVLDMNRAAQALDQNMWQLHDMTRLRRFSQYRVALDQAELAVLQVQIDPCCQFRAMAHQVYGTEDAHQVVRYMTLNEMLQHPQRYEQAVSERGIDLQEYVAEMSADDKMGDHLTLFAMADLYSTNILIYSPAFPRSLLVPASSAITDRVYCLAYTAFNTYHSLVLTHLLPLQQPSSTPCDLSEKEAGNDKMSMGLSNVSTRLTSGLLAASPILSRSNSSTESSSSSSSSNESVDDSSDIPMDWSSDSSDSSQHQMGAFRNKPAILFDQHHKGSHAKSTGSSLSSFAVTGENNSPSSKTTFGIGVPARTRFGASIAVTDSPGTSRQRSSMRIGDDDDEEEDDDDDHCHDISSMSSFMSQERDVDDEEEVPDVESSSMDSIKPTRDEMTMKNSYSNALHPSSAERISSVAATTTTTTTVSASVAETAAATVASQARRAAQVCVDTSGASPASLIDICIDTIARALPRYASVLRQGMSDDLLARFIQRLVALQGLDAGALQILLNNGARALNLSQWQGCQASSLLVIRSTTHASLEKISFHDCPSLDNSLLRGFLETLSSSSSNSAAGSASSPVTRSTSITSTVIPTLGLSHSKRSNPQDTTSSLRSGSPSMQFSSSFWSKLRVLDLSGCSQIQDSAFASLTQHALPQVHRLCLDNLRKLSDRGLSKLLLACPRLLALHARRCSALTDAALEDLQGPLQIVDVSECGQLTDAAVVRIAEQSKEVLRSLSVEQLLLTDLSLAAVAQSCVRVEIMEASGCQRFTDRGLERVLRACQQLRILRLPDCRGLTGAAFSRLDQELPSLQVLDLARCFHLESTHAGVLASKCPSLREIDLQSCESLADQSIAAIARGCRHVERLRLASCMRLSDASVIAIAGATGSTLRELSLHNCGAITDAAVTALARGCPLLEVLDLSWCEELTDVALVSVAEYLPRLRTLRLEQVSKPCGDGFMAIARACADLRVLSLGYTMVRDHHLLTLCQHAQGLTELDLSACQHLSSKAIRDSVSLLPLLRTLALRRYDHVNGNTLVHPRLDSLSLSFCGQLSDTCLLSLARNCPSLSELDVAWCTKLTSSSVHQLGVSCPRLRSLSIRGCRSVALISIKALCNRGVLVRR